MFEKMKTWVVEHKLDVIEKGAMVLGAVIGIVVVAVSLGVGGEEPMDDNIIDITLK